MGGYFYIMASGRYKTLYSGVTNNLIRRGAEHKQGNGSKFTAKYGVQMLVYYEYAERIEDVIAREKCVKRWRRDWKLELIEKMNPEWRDLYEDLLKQ
jgi:putative endonuclease